MAPKSPAGSGRRLATPTTSKRAGTPSSAARPAAASPPRRPVTPSSAARSTPGKGRSQLPGAAPGHAISDSQRRKLRHVFDTFDVDRSGSISTKELGAILSQAKVKLSAEKLAKLVADADADGSGEIEFNEFVSVLQKHLAGGSKDGLGAAVMDANSALGWLNPLSWFGDGGSGDGSAGGSHGAGSRDASPGAYYANPIDLGQFSPTHRMKATQGLIQKVNRETGSEVRKELDEAKMVAQQRREIFQQRQKERIATDKEMAVSLAGGAGSRPPAARPPPAHRPPAARLPSTAPPLSRRARARASPLPHSLFARARPHALARARLRLHAPAREPWMR